MDDLSGLPYLDAVVRETLRVHAPVPMSFRVAMKDDVIPLSQLLVDKRGFVHDGIPYVAFFLPFLFFGFFSVDRRITC
jgi:hypothetical protein